MIFYVPNVHLNCLNGLCNKMHSGLQIEGVLAYFTHLKRQKCIGVDCHQPPFGWIANDCLGMAFIVLHRRWRQLTNGGL
jgi:hypothetical protein